MANICEKCPITIKASYCCRSNPETGNFKWARLEKSGVRIQVCSDINSSGLCEIYNTEKMPPTCKEYGCEKWYKQGLNLGSLV